jgi:hypothetical protein
VAAVVAAAGAGKKEIGMKERKHLQAVMQGEPAPDRWFEEQATALLARALADKPTSIVMLWETDHGVSPGSVPRSDALIRGTISFMHAALNGGAAD